MIAVVQLTVDSKLLSPALRTQLVSFVLEAGGAAVAAMNGNSFTAGDFSTARDSSRD